MSAVARLWWLYGPPSVGKSATAWELHTDELSGEPRGYFDVDQVGMCYPERERDPGNYALKARAASAVVRRFTQAGARTVVVSGVLDEGSLADVVEAVDPVRVTFCRLRVEPEELRRRLERRYGPKDVKRALTEATNWDRYGSTHAVVDTGEGDPPHCARRVAEALRAAAPSAPGSIPRPGSPAQSALTASVGRAVLICGPAAVGKSTVGFGLFMSRLATGRAAAYLDLQQFGFLADLPDDAPSRHEIIASCVADLWQEYRGVGAQDLVLTGHVERPEDVQRYRDALGDTPLLVCRLQADSQSLQERILARIRGGGPSLAGDMLVGLPTSGAEAVLQRATAQQARLEEQEISDLVLDTGGETPEAVRQQLVDSLDRLNPSSGTAGRASADRE